MLISAIDYQPTSQKDFDKLFSNIELPWKEIYLTARKAIANSHLRCFHYKIINNVLYLNKKLFQFDNTPTPLCSFCHTEAETTLHVFHKCAYRKYPQSVHMKIILSMFCLDKPVFFEQGPQNQRVRL